MLKDVRSGALPVEEIPAFVFFSPEELPALLEDIGSRKRCGYSRSLVSFDKSVE